MTVDYQPLTSAKMRNINISSIIIGNLTTNKVKRSPANSENGSFYAIATLDGTLMLVKKEEIIWLVKEPKILISDCIYQLRI